MSAGQAGAILTITVPEGSDLAPLRECQGYTVRLGDETWRGIVRRITPGDGTIGLEIVLSDRVPARYGPWAPLDRDGLPPVTYPSWRAQEKAKRQEAS